MLKLIPLALIMSMLNCQVEGDCCYMAAYSYPNLYGYCADASLVSGQYCGKGDCNIFGCNCDGGCRYWPSKVVTYTMHGEKCAGPCQLYSASAAIATYYWCDTMSGWDYCSPRSLVDIHGQYCSDECAKRGQDYFWCNRKIGSWDYCGNKTSYLDNSISYTTGIIIFLSVNCI